MHRLLGLCALLIPLLAGAAVYKYRDESGNLVFSDRPHPGAERVKIDSVQTYQQNNKAPAETNQSTVGTNGAATTTADSEEQVQAQYTDIAITSPGPGEAVRENAGNVSISVAVNPALAANDNVIILLDGQRVAGPSKAMTVALKEISRGEHHIEAQVVDASGTVLKSTSSIFYLLRTSIRPLRSSELAPPPSLIRRVLSFLTS